MWVSNVTYIKYGENAYYICVIINLFSRMVVDYKIGNTNSTQLVKSNFQLTYKARQRIQAWPSILTVAVTAIPKQWTIICGCWISPTPFHMPYDKSVMESVFASLKREELYRTKERTFVKPWTSTLYSITLSTRIKNCNTRLPNRRKKNMPWRMRI